MHIPSKQQLLEQIIAYSKRSIELAKETQNNIIKANKRLAEANLVLARSQEQIIALLKEQVAKKEQELAKAQEQSGKPYVNPVLLQPLPQTQLN